MIRVLLLDDDLHFCRLMTAILPTPDYELISVQDGFMALDLLQRDSSFDVLLLDLQLPGMDGLDFLVQIKKAIPTMPVIIVSARTNPIANLLQHGVTAYLQKPFHSQLLVDAINGVVFSSDENP